MTPQTLAIYHAEAGGSEDSASNELLWGRAIHERADSRKLFRATSSFAILPTGERGSAPACGPRALGYAPLHESAFLGPTHAAPFGARLFFVPSEYAFAPGP